MTILELLEEGGSIKAFSVTPVGGRTYVGSYASDLRTSIKVSLESGWSHVIAIGKRSGFIADGKEWAATVHGLVPGGPFFAFNPSFARIQALSFIISQG